MEGWESSGGWGRVREENYFLLKFLGKKGNECVFFLRVIELGREVCFSGLGG